MTKTTKARKLEAYPETRKKRWGAGIILAILSVLFLLFTGAAQLAQAQSFTTLYSFQGGNGGAWPDGGLVADSSGNLFGTTYGGTVFELPCSGTPCTYPTSPTVLATYLGNTVGLTIDSSGNLYGTTSDKVFELPCSGTPCTYPNMKWLYYASGSYGDHLTTGVVVDSSGNLYGTAAEGGSTSCNTLSEIGWLALGQGCGTVFKLSPPTGSATQYTVSVLHLFTSSGPGGFNPVGGLAIDQSSGTLYGTTMLGGGGHYGAVFKLSTAGTGFQVLHTFSGLDGANPIAGVVLDSYGNLYGTTFQGGSSLTSLGIFGAPGLGTVFELSPPAEGSTAYTERVLFSCHLDPLGANPGSRLLMDSSGNLYGTTYFGGRWGEGIVFKLDPSSGTMTVLHNFEYGNSIIERLWPRDMLNAFPFSISAGLAMGPLGNLYGTTYLGCSGCSSTNGGAGTVFEVTNPDGETRALIIQVNALLTAEVINQGQDGSLVRELQHAIKMIDAGKLHGAIGNLESFITEVDDLENSGVLTSEQAAPLVNLANAVIQQLQASS